MKELSEKEKAQRYDEALERARYWEKNPTVWSSDDICQKLFPELKESKDERIRKYIISSLNSLLYTKGSQADKERNDAIAWLEKQGEKETLCDKCRKEQPSHSCQDITELGRCAVEHEQKPTSKVEPKFKVGDIIKSKKNGDTVKVEQILSDSYCYSGWDGAATCYCDFSISEQDNWELVEQNPVENSAKVSESSTEEKDMGEYKKGFECGKQRVLKYPEDFGLCKKSAWSEEDEINLEKAIWYVENPAPMVVKDSMLVEWLKSLKDRYAWKPSKEQIMALAKASETYCDRDKNTLYSLYNDLKKLREE